MSTEGETLQFSVLPYRCSICPPLVMGQMSIFGKFQDTERFLIPCPHHVWSWLPPSSETCKYATALSTQKNLERFSTYWYAPFCCVFLGCCAAKFGSSGGTYELPCILKGIQLCVRTQWEEIYFIFLSTVVKWKLYHKKKRWSLKTMNIQHYFMINIFGSIAGKSESIMLPVHIVCSE